MNRIPLGLKEFDYLWSSCAFEHLGSIEHGLGYVLDSLKCLRPGGIAVHTTEFNVSSNDRTVDLGPTVLFRRKDLERLVSELKGTGAEIEVDFTDGSLPADQFVDRPPYKQDVHLKIAIGEFTATSVGLIVRKRE